MAIDMTGIRWILCDLGNVLVNFDRELAHRGLVKFLGESGQLGRAPSPAVFSDFFFSPTPCGPSRIALIETGRTTIEALHHAFEAQTGITIPFATFLNLWNDIFPGTNEDVFRAMATARQRGIKTAITSTTSLPHWEFIRERFPRVQEFDDYFLSFEFRVLKTEPEFFDEVLRRTGAAPQEHLFIDDLRPNLDCAAAKGIQTFLYQGVLPDWLATP